MDINKLKNVVRKSCNISQVSKELYSNTYSGNRTVIMKYIKEYNIDTSHFTYKSGKKRNKFPTKLDLSEILIKNSTYLNTSTLKNRLYKEGLKKRKCEECGQDENWRGKKMFLILDHINGTNNDNRIDNLRILCPNCNSTLRTHGGKNIKVFKK